MDHSSHVMRGRLLLLGSLLALGCQKSAMPTAPISALAPTAPVTVSFGPGESIPAMFEVTVDPASMQATSRPLTARTAAGFQASQIDLDITKFQTNAQFEVQSVQFTAIGDVEVTFRHAHPWGPVDIIKPPSATNRADLGYTGRLLILADLQPADIPSHTFFGDVIANTELVREANGYVQPGDLLAKSGFNANCFPYMLLADEAKDNRIGVSNNGEDIGNWDPAVGGWQRSNLGPNGDGWTGYDFVHAGQTIENSFVLNADELTGGPVTLQVALLIKYTEPKGVGGEAGRMLRLPPETVDIGQFAYRAPHAALDGSALIQEIGVPDGLSLRTWPMHILQLESTPGATAFFGNKGRDWDVTALESSEADLAAESDVAAVRPGGAGPGTIHVDCPDVSAVGWELTPAGRNFNQPINGKPDDEIWWSGTITNDLGATTGGGRFQDLPALVRWNDPEAVLAPDGNPHFGVDPATLVPSTARALAPVTFQALTIRILDPPPSWTVYNLDPDWVNGSGVSMAVIPDAAGPGADRLGITYFDESGRKLKYARALSASPAQPSDWLISIVDPVTNECVDRSKLIAYQGRPAVIYWAIFGTGLSRTWALWLAQATTSTPSGPDDWNRSLIKFDFPRYNYPPGETDRPKSQIDLAIDPTDALIAVAGNYTTQDVWFFRAQSQTPTGIADWWDYPLLNISDVVTSAPGEPHAWLQVDGAAIWCLAESAHSSVPGQYRDFNLRRSTTPTPSQASDWEDWSRFFTMGGNEGYGLELHYSVLPLAVDQGQPYLVGSEFEWMYLAKKRPQQPRAWTYGYTSAGAGKSYGVNIRFVDGLPRVSSLGRGTTSIVSHEVMVAYGLMNRPAEIADWQRSTIPTPPSGIFGATLTSLSSVGYQDRDVIAFRGDSVSPQLHLAFTNSAW